MPDGVCAEYVAESAAVGRNSGPYLLGRDCRSGGRVGVVLRGEPGYDFVDCLVDELDVVLVNAVGVDAAVLQEDSVVGDGPGNRLVVDVVLKFCAQSIDGADCVGCGRCPARCRW